MIVELHLDAGPVRRWHLRTIERIASLPGLTLRVSRADRGPATSLPDTLFRLEKLVYGVPEGHPAEVVDDASLPGPDGSAIPADVVMDITGRWPAGDVPVVRLCCNGAPPDVGAVDAVLAGVVPVLTLDLAVDGTQKRIAGWRVAVEEPYVAMRGVGTVFGRAVQLLVQVAADLAAGADLRHTCAYVTDLGPGDPSRRLAPASFAAGMFAQRVAAKIRQHLRLAPRWSTGLRRLPAGADGQLPQLSGATFHRLPDDGRRFYADPFLWRRDGRDFLFVEEFPFATERGVLSVAEIGADGRPSRPRVVLEADCHLSFPFLLEHDGVVYLVPESSRRRAVELWRSVSFPDRWERAAVLVDDVDVVDATVVRRADAWYLLASPRQEWTSSWDALAIWTAPHLEGPWQPVPGNPVMVDVASARSAGTPFLWGDRLVRPVQDCVGRYGAGLGFAVVDRLDAGGFAQTMVGALRPARPLSGLHTYNRSSVLETVDVFGPRHSGRFTVRERDG